MSLSRWSVLRCVDLSRCQRVVASSDVLRAASAPAPVGSLQSSAALLAHQASPFDAIADTLDEHIIDAEAHRDAPPPPPARFPMDRYRVVGS